MEQCRSGRSIAGFGIDRGKVQVRGTPGHGPADRQGMVGFDNKIYPSEFYDYWFWEHDRGYRDDRPDWPPWKIAGLFLTKVMPPHVNVWNYCDFDAASRVPCRLPTSLMALLLIRWLRRRRMVKTDIGYCPV